MSACHVLLAGVWKRFDRGRIEVLRGVNLAVEPGELVALCGSSGCGKSTLLAVTAGLETADEGVVSVLGHSPVDERARVQLLRRHIGFVFQLHHLVTDLTLRENLLVPTIAAGARRRDAMARAEWLSEVTGLAERLDRRVRELSGGERQRGALCRALMNDPALLLADEPTGALDERTRGQVFELLLELVRGQGKTLIMATHDRELAACCDRVLVMRNGRFEP